MAGRKARRFTYRGGGNATMSKPIKLIAVLLICAVLLPAAGSSILSASAAPLATAPDLGTAASYSVLAGSTVTNSGPTTMSGNLGVSPGLAITGFPPGIVLAPGAKHANDAAAQQAQSDVTTAYNNLAGQPCNTNLTGQDLGGMTLTPGVYCFNTSAQLTGHLVLNAQGNADAVWIFKMGSTLTTASNASVTVINAGTSCNAFWQVGSSATLGTGTGFAGRILALASITMNTGATASGSALARNGAVTMDTNTISTCSGTTAIAMRDFRATSAAGSPIGLGAGAGLLLAVGLIVIRRRAPATPNAAPSARQGDGK
jgi:hypothetical protein